MKVFIRFDFILIFFLQNNVRKTFKKCVCFTHAKDFKCVFSLKMAFFSAFIKHE